MSEVTTSGLAILCATLIRSVDGQQQIDRHTSQSGMCYSSVKQIEVVDILIGRSLVILV